MTLSLCEFLKTMKICVNVNSLKNATHTCIQKPSAPDIGPECDQVLSVYIQR